ncbi:MAG TPA: ABC transporter permease [Opitutus sp.]|nr:ABC transporter permease [Opitutus sp.]
MKLVLRSLLKSPGFAAIALLTLALGIGVNTAMFSVVSAFLLQPAPYPHADQLVRVYRTSPQSQTWPHSVPDLDDLRAQSHVLAGLAAFQWWSFSLASPGQPAKRLQGLVASADFFQVIGVQPALGRAFTKEEQVPGRDQVVVLTDAIWRSRYAADPGIVGRTIRVDGANQTVIGVMPPGFAYPLLWGRLDAIRPLVLSADWQHQRGNHWLGAIARLQPGVSLAQAQAEAGTIGARLAQHYPDTNAGTGLRLVPLHETAMDESGRNASWLLLALSGFVLLIACANLANLQLARSAARARDLAVRAALGASRLRLMRQLIVESIVLALAGGGLGVLVAVWLDYFLSRRLDIAGAGVPIPLDWNVLAFALGASVLAGLLSGAVPAWFAARVDVNAALKAQSRGATGDRTRHRVRHALIVAEIAFALVLLAGAGFFIRGLQRFAARDPGWRPAGLIAGNVTLPDTLPTDRYVNEDVRRQFYDRLLQRIATLPGVEHACLASSLPIYSFSSSRNFSVEGRADPPAGQEPLADYAVVAGDFLGTVGLQLVQGRMFPDNLRADSPRYAIINESMARQFWPGGSAVGQRIGGTGTGDRNWTEIIGVVRDVGFVGNIGTPDTRFQVYLPLVQEPWGYLTIALRAKHPQALAEPLRRAVAGLDPDLPVADLKTIEQSIDNAQHNIVVANQLLGGFALLGLVLSAIGLYGVISTLVVQRTNEFGIRLALGAQARDVLWLVLGKSLRLTVLGCALGLLGAGGLVLFLGRLMPGLPGSDPLVLAAIVLLLCAVALGACLLPARRATQVDPIVALRAE